MSSASDGAEGRFRSAFERLKAGKPRLVPRGTPVSQNNVAKEAGTDPSALKKARYPELIAEIQGFIEAKSNEMRLRRERRAKQGKARLSLRRRVKKLEQERDSAQSQLLNAERTVLELLHEREELRAKIDALLPPPKRLR